MRIRTKFFIEFVTIAVTPVLIASLITFNESRKITRDLIFAEEMNSLEEECEKFDIFLEHYISKTRVISQLPPIQGIIRSMETGFDPADSSTIVQWKKRLIDIFTSYLANDPNIVQLRFINERGLELVRVDSRKGVISTTPDSSLQDKSNREYFLKTAQLKERDVWVSPIELNIERGKVEIPHLPVTRVCTPVFSKTDGTRCGMLILNISATYMLGQLIEEEHRNSSIFMIDENGYYLHHPVTEKIFGRQLEHGQNYFKDYGDGFRQISENDFSLHRDAGRKELRIWKKIFYNRSDTHHYWVLISLVKEQAIFSPITRLQWGITVLMGAMLLVVFVTAYRTSRSISLPIEQLKMNAGEVSKGNYAVRFNPHYIEKNDEIGELYRSMNDMTKKLIDANSFLEAEVARRIRDIHKSESQAQTVLDTVVDGIITIDEEGTIQTLNSGAEKMFGYRKEEIAGTNVNTLMPSPFREEHDSYIRNYKRTGRKKIIGGSHEVAGRRKDGTTFPMLLSIGETIVDGRSIFTGFARDITELKKVDEMKSEFISVVSHELRTPLTSIRGSLGLMNGGVTGVLPEKAKEMVTIAVRNSDRLIRLINDILDIEKIESGKMELHMEPLELMSVIRQNIASNNGYAKEYDVDFVIKDPLPDCMVEADQDALSQIITNLLSNSAKFSPRKGTVDIYVMKKDGIVRVSIKDYGPGISEEFQKKIFHKFAQSDSSDTRQKGGTGLGLSITKALVEKMNGTLSFETAPGFGTVFYFELPEWNGNGD